MLTTLLLSFGIPMLLGGDEMGRTQQGNNNAYCQDNEITWFDWSRPDTGLLDFTKRLIGLRRTHPVFCRNRFLAGADFLVLVNAWWEPFEFVLPATRPEASWRVEIDTYDLASPAGAAAARYAGDHVTAGPRCVVVLLSPR